MGPTGKWIKPALFLLLNQLFEAVVEGLVCNYCYNANIKADCRINTRTCGPKKVCYIETSYITYDESRHGSTGTKELTIYKMGCEHYSLCKDRVSHGPGPYGYAKIHIFCCCTDRCETADEIAKMDKSECPRVWDNYTEINLSPSPRAGPPHLLLLPAVTFFIWDWLST